ncbi:MAG: YgiQ family radical SAM protein [Oscillospiraceae bacterium]|nr:YgiQ family radical SAM protein [Oscillospiraceae bacterium]
MKNFLPTKHQKNLDFICLTGDAYVDHPSFGVAIISRMLESLGFSVGVIAQPVGDCDYARLGTPALAFMVTAGNIDSMVANYTVSGKRRNDDAYSENGAGGKRPDRAVITYCKTLKKLFPDREIIIGGLESSLRRFAHYDYWSDTVMPSILVDSGADLLIYGMAELTLVQLARRLQGGEKAADIHDLRGTCYLTEPQKIPAIEDFRIAQCADFEVVRDNKKAYAKACKTQYNEQDEITGKAVIQRHGKKILVQNPPQRSLTTDEMDKVYELPYARTFHPDYAHVPAIEEVEFSIIHNRGCFGACAFCSLALHQGRRIQTRSAESVIDEAVNFTKNPRFKGYIHDVGGPTANFRKPSCTKQIASGFCKNKKCMTCENLEVSHADYLALLRKLRALKGVKKVFVRSGIRFDYVNRDPDKSFLRELVAEHTSGQLKVAPEHCVPKVLDLMNKPHIAEYLKFAKDFYSECKNCRKEQYLIPYFISSHPGATLENAVELAVFLKKNNIRPEQVQDFYPTPGTISTAMFYTGLDPFTMQEVYVAKTAREKEMQRALLQYYKPENRAIIQKALQKINRRDLIGNSANCLIRKMFP